MTNLILDRTHRFKIGERVRHIDQTPGSELAYVVALTLRADLTTGMAYPTYSLRDPVLGETVTDVLCTLDLVAVS